MLGGLKGQVRRLLLKRKYAGRNIGIGRGASVTNATLGHHVDLSWDTIVLDASIGDYSYIGARTAVIGATIGRYCSIASDVQIGTGSHPSRGRVSSHPVFYLARPARGWTYVDRDSFQEFGRTVVGNDVWIGAKATIRDGVTIGDGAIVGAGAVVVKDIEPYAIHGGVPARLIRYRFTETQIVKLLTLRWWDRDETWIRGHAALFADVDAFIDSDESGSG
jgi:acetyltransferase-like isoleucine patch superfamily enzyme